MSDNTISKAAFLRWFKPLLTALKDLGGSGTPDEVRAKIAENEHLSDEELNTVVDKTDTKKFANDVAWARNYLAMEGYIDKSVRGVWSLTKEGYIVDMTEELASDILKKGVKENKAMKEYQDNDKDDISVVNTWLLNWNPSNPTWQWEEQEDEYSYGNTVKTVKSGGTIFFCWRCVSKQIKEGERIFIVKLGSPPRGIFATGYATSNTYENKYTDDNGEEVTERLIDICITGILDYHTEELISQDFLKKKFSNQQWSPQGSGISIKPEAARWLIENWDNHVEEKTTGEIVDLLPPSNSEFLKYFAPLIQAIKDLGGSATRKEAHEKVIELMDITEEELSVTYEKTGASRVLNQIDFARNDLAHEGFISSGTKGVWALTELGMNIDMTMELAGLIHMKWVKINTAKRKGEPIPEIDLSKYYKKKIGGFWHKCG